MTAGTSEGAKNCFLVVTRRSWLERTELGAAARRTHVRGRRWGVLQDDKDKGAGSCWSPLFALLMRHLSFAQLTSVLGLLPVDRQSPFGNSTPVVCVEGAGNFFWGWHRRLRCYLV
ncbi:unnamed protein product [Ectocarpus sp. 13 AM-2016]